MSFPRESIGRHFCFQDSFLQKSPVHRFHATALVHAGMTWKGDFYIARFRALDFRRQMVFPAAVSLYLVAICSWQTDLSRGVGRDDDVPFKTVAFAFP